MDHICSWHECRHEKIRKTISIILIWCSQAYPDLLKISGCVTVNAVDPLSANPMKWPNILKQFVGNLPTNCLSVFGHFVKLALKGLIYSLVDWYRKK